MTSFPSTNTPSLFNFFSVFFLPFLLVFTFSSSSHIRVHFYPLTFTVFLDPILPCDLLASPIFILFSPSVFSSFLSPHSLSFLFPLSLPFTHPPSHPSFFPCYVPFVIPPSGNKCHQISVTQSDLCSGVWNLILLPRRVIRAEHLPGWRGMRPPIRRSLAVDAFEGVYEERRRKVEERSCKGYLVQSVGVMLP